jgi:hypothetical protein
MSSARERHPHPINTGCHDQLRATNLIEINQKSPTLVLSSSTSVLSLSNPNSTITLIYCSSFVPVAIGGVLVGLSMLEQTKMLLARRGPYRPGVHCIFTMTSRRPVAYTGLTGCLYRSDWSVDLEVDQAHLWLMHVQVLQCVTRSYVNTFLATPLGTKRLSSATMADDKGNLSEVDSRNIIISKLGELSEEFEKPSGQFLSLIVMSH